MTWMLTMPAGREHHLAGPGQLLNVPTLEEIAGAISKICRFNGHCRRHYSVAEHSILCADLAADEGAGVDAQLAALLHDAHEAYTTDLPSPIKWTIGASWEVFEHSQAAALHNALGVRALMHSHRANVKRWDLMALATERRDLLVYDPLRHLAWPMLDNPAAPVLPHPEFNLMAPARKALMPDDLAEDWLHRTRWLQGKVAERAAALTTQKAAA